MEITKSDTPQSGVQSHGHWEYNVEGIGNINYIFLWGLFDNTGWFYLNVNNFFNELVSQWNYEMLMPKFVLAVIYKS